MAEQGGGQEPETIVGRKRHRPAEGDEEGASGRDQAQVEMLLPPFKSEDARRKQEEAVAQLRAASQRGHELKVSPTRPLCDL